MKKYLKLMRVHHYIKNIIIFFPLVFSGNLLADNLLVSSLLGFIAFCFISSAIYIINDIRDIEADKNHSTKCNRPLASGAISIPKAITLLIILFILSLGFTYLSCGFNLIAFAILLTYFILNIAYSCGLKNVPIIDVAILASGYLLRLLYGSAITNIEISNWLYLTVTCMAFYIGLGKRRGEILKETDSKRKVLKFYTKEFLDSNMYMCLALTLTFYSLWSVDPLTVARAGNNNLIWTVPLVILICMKYNLTIHGDSDGDPVEVVLKDKLLLILIFVFGLITFGIIYW